MTEVHVLYVAQFQGKALLLVLATLIVIPAMRTQSALLRQWLLRITIVALLLLPALTFLGPKILIAEQAATAHPLSVDLPLRDPPQPEFNPVPHQSPPPLAAPESETLSTHSSRGFASLLFALCYGYAGIAVILMLRYCWLLRKVRGRVDQLPFAKDKALLAQLSDTCESLGVKQRVSLKSDACQRAPFVWGLAQPHIVLPADFVHWPASVQHTSLLHELVHIRKRDFAWSLLAKVCCCVYWPNPVIWQLAKRLSLAAEQACDDAVLAHCQSPESYAESLVQIACSLRSPGRTVESLAPTMAGESSLKQRVVSILNPRQKRNSVSSASLALFSLGIASLSLLTFAIEPEPSADTSYPPPFKRSANMPASSFALLHRVHPVYPPAAKNNQIAGHVIVEFDISPNGMVENPLVVESQPAQIFDAASVAAVQQWLYLPDYVDGKAQRSEGVRTRLTFALADENPRGLESLPVFSVRAEQLGGDVNEATTTDLAALREQLQDSNLRVLSPVHASAIIAEAEHLARRLPSGEGYILLASIHEQRQSWPQAQLALAKAFEKGKLLGADAARFQTARVLYHSNRYGEAREILETLIAAYPKEKNYRNWLTVVESEAARTELVAAHLTDWATR